MNKYIYIYIYIYMYINIHTDEHMHALKMRMCAYTLRMQLDAATRLPADGLDALPWRRLLSNSPSDAGEAASDSKSFDDDNFFEEESDRCSELEAVEPPPKRSRITHEIAKARAENLTVKRVKESLEAEVLRAVRDIPAPELPAIQACAQSLPSKLRLFPPCISYWCQWMTGQRRCGKTCKYLHSKLPEGSVAKSLAIQSLGKFAIEDSSKQVSNWVLHDVASDLEEKRCFVLDGANAATINALQRPREGILSPNVDARATTAL